MQAPSTPRAIPEDAKRPVIVLTGGGSGGHITPVLAVARALKQKAPQIHLVYVGHQKDSLGDVVKTSGDIDEIKLINGGKWRRYHGEGWRQIFDIVTLAKNVRDFFRLLIGTVQSWFLLKHLKPAGVFIKGAYVGVPIGWASRWLGIPYVTLDLDAFPSLANRLIAKHAAAHAVAMPKEAYPYPPDKTFYVGVPISKQFTVVTPQQQLSYRRELGLEAYEQVLLVIGGGLGALRLNETLIKQAPELLNRFPRLALLHVVGREHEAAVNADYDKLFTSDNRRRVVVKGFVDDVYRYSGAADVVVSRAGATSLAEFAAQAKACIIVPNPQLTGGHQVKNAEQLAAHSAIMILSEDTLQQDEAALVNTIEKLLTSPEARGALGQALHSFARPDAADKVADLLLQTFKQTSEHETTAPKS